MHLMGLGSFFLFRDHLSQVLSGGYSGEFKGGGDKK